MAESFDERYQVQNVRVVNRLSFFEVVLATALGVAAGAIVLVLVVLSFNFNL